MMWLISVVCCSFGPADHRWSLALPLPASAVSECSPSPPKRSVKFSLNTSAAHVQQCAPLLLSLSTSTSKLVISSVAWRLFFGARWFGSLDSPPLQASHVLTQPCLVDDLFITRASETHRVTREGGHSRHTAVLLRNLCPTRPTLPAVLSTTVLGLLRAPTCLSSRFLRRTSRAPLQRRAAAATVASGA